MSKKERAGNPELPEWWLAKAIPLLDSPSIKNADIARAASQFAERPAGHEWRSDAISKFKDGIGRSVALANGISQALGVPPPFFTAPTERAASEMLAVARRAQEELAVQRRDEERASSLKVIDGVAAKEIAHGIVTKSLTGVVSSPNGDTGGRGVRTRGTRRGRS